MNTPIVRPAFLVPRSVIAGFVMISGITLARSAEPVAPAEARAILREARRDLPRDPGSYRETIEHDTKNGHVSRTTMLLITPDRRVFSRAEATITVNGHPEQTRHTVIVTTPDGRWHLHREAAVLEPLANIEPLLETARQVADAPATAEPEATQRRSHPYLAGALEVERHGQYTRERLEREGRDLLILTETYDDEGRRALNRLSETLFKDARRQFGFPKRLLIDAYVGLADVPSKLPAKYRFEIDAATGRLLSTEVTNVAGQSRTRRAPQSRFVATNPLTEAEFALPSGLLQLRPKGQADFIQFQNEQEAKDAESAAAHGR